ncbi:MAG: hypothetical protein KF802_02780 [Bdellovibrionaceae bacterium]|nr:hypothetical protein [Pseudobdellovibrionaceae bacterium]
MSNNQTSPSVTVHTDYHVLRYIPQVVEEPEIPLTEREKKMIVELDFPTLAGIYAKAFESLLEPGETKDDLIQEAWIRLPIFLKKYDKAYLTKSEQRLVKKDMHELIKKFRGFLKIHSQFYSKKTFDSAAEAEDTKYIRGENHEVIVNQNYLDDLHSITSGNLLKEEFIRIRRELWSQLPATPSITSKKYKPKTNDKRNCLQYIVDMKDEGSVSGTITLAMRTFGWDRATQIQALEIIERYNDVLWERTNFITSLPHSNWASDWLEALEDRTFAALVKGDKKVA